jgi:tetratricopeptide (TPR) repeat protein
VTGRWPAVRLGLIEAAILVALVASIAWRVNADRAGDAAATAAPPSNAASADVLAQRADDAYEDGRLAEASALYSDVLHADDDAVHARVRLASIFQRNSWNATALSMIDEALALDPANAVARLLRAKVYRDEGEGALAVAEYEALLGTQPRNAEALYYVGTSYQAARRFDDAIVAYRRGVEADVELAIPPFERVPFGVQSRLQLGRTYRQLSRVQFQASGYADGMSLLELSLDALRDAHGVVASISLTQYSDVRAELTSTLSFKMTMLRRAQRPETDVLAVFEEMIQVDPDDVGAWLDAGQIRRRAARTRADLEVVETYFARAYELDPRDLDAHTNLVSVRQDLDRNDADLTQVLQDLP